MSYAPQRGVISYCRAAPPGSPSFFTYPVADPSQPQYSKTCNSAAQNGESHLNAALHNCPPKKVDGQRPARLHACTPRAFGRHPACLTKAGRSAATRACPDAGRDRISLRFPLRHRQRSPRRAPHPSFPRRLGGFVEARPSRNSSSMRAAAGTALKFKVSMSFRRSVQGDHHAKRIQRPRRRISRNGRPRPSRSSRPSRQRRSPERPRTSAPSHGARQQSTRSFAASFRRIAESSGKTQ
jgi:hypothetical protein